MQIHVENAFYIFQIIASVRGLAKKIVQKKQRTVVHKFYHK